MPIGSLLKFYRYALAWENYWLLLRAIRAAHLVRRLLPDGAATPRLAASLPVIDSFYLPPQPHWRISDAEKVARFANFVANFPTTWGRCLQRSLITYRLLNGYGIPARLCCGVSQSDPHTDGHAWVVRLGDNRPVAETTDPRQRFTLIYTSSLPKED
jgi:hypothetical protein